MLSLAVYSDSEEDSDDQMHDKSHNKHKTGELDSEDHQADSPEQRRCVQNGIPSTSISIPGSPSIDPIDSVQQRMKELFEKSKDENCSYSESTFKSADFADNPRFIANSIRKLHLFHDDDGNRSYSKTEQYSSALSLSIFNPMDHLSKEDNVDVLMKMLEQKIRENERRFQEKRERRERQKQSMKAHAEKRMPTPANGQLYQQQQQRFVFGNQTLNALVNGNQRPQEKKRRKGSRWDEKR